MDTAGVLKKSSGWAIAWSVLLIVLGVIAIAIPAVAAVAVTTLVAWLLIVGGIFHFVMAFSTRGAGAVLWEVLVALVYIFGGGYMLFYCPFHRKHRVAEALIAMGAKVTEFEFAPAGLTTWSVDG